jgi:hypothetical protein
MHETPGAQLRQKELGQRRTVRGFELSMMIEIHPESGPIRLDLHW